MKEVLVVKPRGFCAGVVRAVDVVEAALRKHGKVWVRHAIVHNQAVVQELANKGAVFVDTVEEVPLGEVVVFSAHGSPPEDFRAAAERNLQVIDAVCPLVTRVHNEARKFTREGRIVIIVGHKGHVEVQGTYGQARELILQGLAPPNGVHVVDPESPGENLDAMGISEHHRDLAPGDKVAILTQTTLSQDDVAPAVEEIRKRFADVAVRNDLCYATTNRQEAVKYLAKVCNRVLVVGSDESSNSRRLAEVSRREGCTAYLIPNAEAIPWFFVRAAQTVGVSSGASTPERLVEEVVESLEKEGYTRREVEVKEEDVHFKELKV